jgi:hypothetical protein
VVTVLAPRLPFACLDPRTTAATPFESLAHGPPTKIVALSV